VRKLAGTFLQAQLGSFLCEKFRKIWLLSHRCDKVSALAETRRVLVLTNILCLSDQSIHQITLKAHAAHIASFSDL